MTAGGDRWDAAHEEGEEMGEARSGRRFAVVVVVLSRDALRVDEAVGGNVVSDRVRDARGDGLRQRAAGIRSRRRAKALLDVQHSS